MPQCTSVELKPPKLLPSAPKNLVDKTSAAMVAQASDSSSDIIKYICITKNIKILNQCYLH